MSEEVWASIKTKVYGQYLASLALPQACATCAKILTPVDTGYDPYHDERIWVTYCCGVSNRFIEKCLENLKEKDLT